MLRAYIIAPYRAESSWKIERNIRKAEELAAELWGAGYAVFCPHSNSRFFNTGVASDDTFLEGDKEWLRQANVAFITGKIKASQGSKGEIEYCIKLRIPFIFTASFCTYLSYGEQIADVRFNPYTDVDELEALLISLYQTENLQSCDSCGRVKLVDHVTDFNAFLKKYF